MAMERRRNAAPPAEFCQQYLDALRAADLREASQIVTDALEAGLPPVVLYADVITPAMERIGDLWQQGEINVGEEHIASAITQQVLVRILDRSRTARFSSRERVMLAADQGQHHVLGLQMVADLLEGAGFDVLYLGADVPVESLGQVAAAKKPALIGLSFGISSDIWDLTESLFAVREGAPACRLMLGGRAAPSSHEIFGLPCVDDFRQVIPTVERLLAGPVQELAPRVPRVPRARRVTKPAKEPVDPAESAIRVLADLAAQAGQEARERSQETERFKRLSMRDPVTDMANRRAFDQQVRAHFEGGRPGGTLLMIDLDNFKEVNDSLGHAHGDNVLRLVSQVINESIRSGDMGARIGGDEFAVLLTNSTVAAAKAVSERIQNQVKELSDGLITASIGIAGLTGDLSQTMGAADHALYAAKAAGRDAVAIDGQYDAELIAADQPTSSGSYLSMSRLRIPVTRSEALIPALRERIAVVEQADGLIGLELLQSDTDEEEIIMVSRWENRADFRAYMESDASGKSISQINAAADQEIELMSLERFHKFELAQ